MTITCWNCKKEIDTSGMNCPHCNVMIDQAIMDSFSGFQIRNTPMSPITPGVVIADRYDIKGEIGRGGMGIVYLAHDNYMERDVALKIIPQELSMDPKAIADLKRETSLALELTHEYIVRLYNLDSWKNLTYVTMEYVPCGTLSHLMVKKGGRLSLKEALPILKQVANSLDYTHRKSPPVMHLDIKPLNILIAKDGSAKIADYGLARVLRDLATRISAWEAAGTLAYMAPEQIRGKGIGPWSDIYALAAVAYEMLSGYPPFHTGDMRWQIMHEEVDPIAYIPDSVNKALLCGLRKDTSTRPDSAGDFVAMLEGEKPVPQLKPDTPPTPTTPFRERRKQEEPAIPQRAVKSGRNSMLILSTLLFVIICGGLGWEIYNRYHAVDGTVRPVPKNVDLLTADKTTMPKIPPKSAEPAQPVENSVTETPIAATPAETIAPAAVAAGNFSVSSDPAGAEVYLDGVGKGSTPLELQNLKAGNYEIHLKKDGFETWSEKIDFNPADPREIKAKLVAASGRMEINSDPKGATVYIDNKKVGQTPLVIEKVEIGTRFLVLENEGFEKWEDTIRVTSGGVVQIAPSLKPTLGDLRVTSEPSQAMVLVGGKQQGLTPYVLTALPSGSLEIEVQKDCFQKTVREVMIKPATITDLHLNLTPVCGSIRVESQPIGARWYLDGKDMGFTPTNMADITTGSHLIKFVLNQYEEQTMTIKVKAGENDPVMVRLKALALQAEAKGTVNTADISRDRSVAAAEAAPAAGNLFIDPVTQMAFVWVEKGCYQMGSSGADPERNVDEGPTHEVCMDGFWIGRYEVTQEQWQKVMGNNPSTLKVGGKYPVVNISWNDAKTFVEKLNGIQKGKYAFGLPSEAEWEYACRSRGKDEPYSGGHQVDLVAWFQGNSKRAMHAVGQKAPNGIGIYDMSGNVYEWVEDCYTANAYNQHSSKNPLFKNSSKYRVCRGGSWLMRAGECRSTNRSYYYPDSRNYNLGFRLVRHS